MNDDVHVGTQRSRYTSHRNDDASHVHRMPSHPHSYNGHILFVDDYVHIYSYHRIECNQVDNDYVHTQSFRVI
jgi:hypothetical protein